MSQKKLKLDDLQVESFHLVPDAPQERGTVEGRDLLASAATCIYQATCVISCTCNGLVTCGASCNVTACDTCDRFTCGGSCDGRCDTGFSGGVFCPQC